MYNKYKQTLSDSNASLRFSRAMMSEPEYSTIKTDPLHITTFNAGRLVPIGCYEVLPDDDFSLDLDCVIRQTTLLVPTMGNMQADIYAFFVPNRIVNESWKMVQGENQYGSWIAPDVELAPLLRTSVDGDTGIQIPVGSVADYYGFPTQTEIFADILQRMHDLKFRGYVKIWNEFFRDQNYQPPIPMSTLNVYQGFLEDANVQSITLDPAGASSQSELSVIGTSTTLNGAPGAGAIANAILPGSATLGTTTINIPPVRSTNLFKAVNPPLKVNKLHDYFTSVLPSPQKGPSVMINGDLANARVITAGNYFTVPSPQRFPMNYAKVDGSSVGDRGSLGLPGVLSNMPGELHLYSDYESTTNDLGALYPNNLIVAPRSLNPNLSLTFDVSDLRLASAVQQVYEVLGRGGSRYREFVKSFFGIDVPDPFSDIPQYLGHLKFNLDLYQTAQTSASSDGSTPQGNLSAFGYTQNGGHLFSQKFVEHGYIHIFVAVRHKNIYSQFLARDNFRLKMLDYYLPQLANISEQPVYTREIMQGNGDSGYLDPSQVWGYQEAWAEYRFDPDYVSGYMRPGVSDSLAVWNYADPVISTQTIATGTWLQSNSEEVLNRTLAVTSSVSHQFRGQFNFHFTKTRPMPIYSVPGMDII
ncbi:major capsid protein [Dipodfec virus UOA04_Rod_708]|nr:major capsid protein [Dipodfec virus UOA04_Rod_708]